MRLAIPGLLLHQNLQCIVPQVLHERNPSSGRNATVLKVTPLTVAFTAMGFLPVAAGRIAAAAPPPPVVPSGFSVLPAAGGNPSIAWQPNDEGTLNWNGAQLNYVAGAPVSGAVGLPGEPETGLTSGSTDKWAGYVGNGGITYTDSDVAYNEPTLSKTSVDRYGSAWAGLGSGNSSSEQLAQDGTEFDSTPSGTSMSTWYEIYPDDPHQVPVTIPNFHPGDDVGAQVKFLRIINSSSFEVTFYWADFTHSEYYSINVVGNGQIGIQADAIVERTEVSGSLPHLSNFGSIDFSYVRFVTGGSSDCTEDNPYDEINMYDGSTLLASTSPNDSRGCSFTVTRSGNE